MMNRNNYLFKDEKRGTPILNCYLKSGQFILGDPHFRYKTAPNTRIPRLSI